MNKQLHKPSAEDVVAYLKENQDFLSNHVEVLLALNVDSYIEGASLLSAKQVQLLRRQLNEAERQFLDLIGTVRVNEKLSIFLHKTSLSLLTALRTFSNADFMERVGLVEETCAKAFKRQMNDVAITLHWFTGFIGTQASEKTLTIDEQDQRVSDLINNVFAAGKACYGPFSQAERTVLLDRFRRKAQSVLAAPLFMPVSGQRMGLLVLSSRRPHRFVAGMGTMFLTQLTELIESIFTPVSSKEQS